MSMPDCDDLYVYPWLLPFSIDPEAGQSKIEAVKHQAKYGSRQSPGDSRTRISSKKLRAALYVRVSTQDQAEGMSIPAQKRRLLERAKEKGWTTSEGCIYSEAVSAEALANRPEMLRALRDAEAGAFDVFMVTDQSRLARNTMDSLYLAQQFLKLGTSMWIDDKGQFVDIRSAAGMFDYTSSAAADTRERMKIKERCDAGRHEAKISGRFSLGHSSGYGWRYEAIQPPPRKGARLKFVIDEKQAKVVRRYIFGMPQFGNVAMAALLNEKGIPTKTGKKWVAYGVRRIRTRRIYCGEYKYQGKVYKAKDVPAIVSKATWLRMQAARKTIQVRDTRAKHLLGGIAFCSYCGEKVYGSRAFLKRLGRFWGAYRCNSKTLTFPKCEKSRSFSMETVDRKLIQNLKEHLGSPGWLKTAHKQYQSQAGKKDLEGELLEIEAKLEGLGEQKDRVVEAIAQGTITKREARSSMTRINREQAGLRTEIESTMGEMRTLPDLDELKKAVSHIESADKSALRGIFCGLVQKVVFSADHVTIHYRFWPKVRLYARPRNTHPRRASK